MNTQTLNIPKSALKYIQILNTGLIQERELISMRSLMNKNKDAANAIFSTWGDNEEITITHEHAEKGYRFLMGQWKTPRGIERKNNPFGYREQHVLENYSHFTLHSLFNAGNAYHDNYLPLYLCYAKDGSAFEYYYNGEVHITG